MVDKLRGIITAGAAAFLLSGCWSNSIPTANSFIRPAASDCRPDGENCLPENIIHVFADANGTFYPSGWMARPGTDRLRRANSLLNAVGPDALARREIEQDQERQLREIAELGRAGGRIFILVHGYNNRVDQADDAYALIEEQLNLRSDDRIIRFYWDGLTSDNWLGSGRIWFYAVGNSQLVGSRALRDILRQFHDRDIFLIGHSRGTSVILSALGNPIYDPDFLERTRRLARSWGIDEDRLLHPPALENNGNDIHVLVAAPAVDRIDFCDARVQPESGGVNCRGEMLRPLGPQVMSFRYTVNSADPILRKLIGLGGNFNPTRLGLDESVGAGLRSERYPMMRCYVLRPPMPEHAFVHYVRHSRFAEMLSDAGIARAVPPRGVEPPSPC